MANSAPAHAEKTRDSQFANLVSTLRAMQVDLPDATKAQSYLKDHGAAVFAASQIEQLATIIDGVVNGGGLVLAPGDKGRNQSCPHFYNFLTESRWSYILSDANSISAIMRGLVDDAAQLGLLWPTEETQATMVSIALKRDNNIAPQQFYERMVELKAMFHDKLAHDKRIAPAMPDRRVANGPRRYPPTGAEYSIAFPTAYADPPVMTRIPEDDLIAYRSRNPWRRSSKLLRGEGHAAHGHAAPAHGAQRANTAMDQAGAFMMQLLMRQAGGAECPVLTYGRSSLDRSRSARSDLLELDDVSRPAASSRGALLALGDAAPTPEAAVPAPAASAQKRPSLDDQSRS